jgi:hypothetical protein
VRAGGGVRASEPTTFIHSAPEASREARLPRHTALPAHDPTADAALRRQPELVVTEAALEKHVTSIFHKLGLGPTPTEHRRVLAVLTYLRDAGS